MAAFMKPFAAHAYALLRIIVGLLFLCHGLQKLFAWPQPMPIDTIPPIVYVAGVIELAGGLLIAVGLFTTWAAFVCSGQMAFAYWMGHGTKAFIPLVNGGELAVLYCFVFLMIAAHGPGIWSADGARGAA